MKIVVNKLIPFKGYKAMCIWPFIFMRKECADRFTPVDENHETIHAQQQLEMYAAGSILAGLLLIAGCELWSLLVIPLFFWWYGIEYLIRLVLTGSPSKAYRNISFEREAYDNQTNFSYFGNRECFSWTKYLMI